LEYVTTSNKLIITKNRAAAPVKSNLKGRKKVRSAVKILLFLLLRVTIQEFTP
jgi:hypothetical protein